MEVVSALCSIHGDDTVHVFADFVKGSPAVSRCMLCRLYGASVIRRSIHSDDTVHVFADFMEGSPAVSHRACTCVNCMKYAVVSVQCNIHGDNTVRVFADSTSELSQRATLKSFPFAAYRRSKQWAWRVA